MTAKVIRDGKVAVLVSSGYGAGWSTWNGDKSCLYWPDVVAWVESGKVGDCPVPDDFCSLGADQLKIVWLPVGTAFRIHEHDGSESIEYQSDFSWEVA